MDDPDLSRTWQSLLVEVRRQGVDHHTAEDVVQEVWLRTLQRHAEKRNVLAWLAVVARRMVSEQRRSEHGRRRRERATAVSDVVVPGAPVEESALRKRVQELRDPWREVLRLRFFEDCETEEIARRLGYSPATIRSYTKRGLDELRVRIEGDSRPRSRLATVFLWLRERLPARRFAFFASGAVVVMLLWSIGGGSRVPSLPLAVLAADRARETPPLAVSDLPPARETLEPFVAPGLPRLAEAEGMRVSGFVLSPEGIPVPGAYVFARLPDQSSREVGVADASGRYDVGPLDPGASLWGRYWDWWASREVCIASMPDPGSFDLVLTPAVGRGILRVLSGDGVPVAGVKLDILLEQELPVLDARCSRPAPQVSASLSGNGALEVPSRRVTTRTDALGQSHLYWPVSRAQVEVTGPGWAPWVGMIEAPGVHETVEIRLSRGLELAGKLRDPGGRLVGNARIELFQHAAGASSARSDPDGRFRIDGLAPGPFVLRAAADDGGPSSIWHEGTIAEGETRELDLELTPRCTIRGRVIQVAGRPKGARVQLILPDREGPEPGQVHDLSADPEGVFQFTGCAPGQEHALVLLGAGGIRLQARPVIPGQEEVVLTPAIETDVLAPLELELRSGAAPSRPTLVEVRAPEARDAARVAGAQTRFSFRSLPQAEYDVVVWCPGLGSYTVASVAHDPRAPETHRLELPVPGRLSVELATPPGVDPARLWVGTRMDGPSRQSTLAGYDEVVLREFELDPASGAFRADLFPGEHWVLVRGPGIADQAELVTIAAGEEVVLSLAAARGFPVALVVDTDPPLVMKETAMLEVQTSRGSQRMPLPLRVRWRGRQEFALEIPVDARRLVVSTSNGSGAMLELPNGPPDTASGDPPLLLRLGRR